MLFLFFSSVLNSLILWLLCVSLVLWFFDSLFSFPWFLGSLVPWFLGTLILRFFFLRFFDSLVTFHFHFPFLDECRWREFYYVSALLTRNYDKMVDNPICRQIEWLNPDTNHETNAHLLAWQEGRTGYPFIDAI